MEFTESSTFGHEDRTKLYEYVDRHGAVEPGATRELLGIDASAFRHHVAILRRDGRLEEVGGRLCVATDAGVEAEHASADVAFHVRPARRADLSGIVGAIRQVTDEQTLIEAETVADEIDHQETLLSHTELESRTVFVATVDEEVVGWAHLHGSELEKLSHTVELTVGVLEDYRGHGIGSHLLSRGLEWAGVNGYEKVYQSVPSTNDGAIAFLERYGWQIEAVRSDHYTIDGCTVDEVMLAMEL